MTTKPFPFQEKILEGVEAFGGRALISAEMGLGKTVMALLAAQRHPEWRPVVVVCPASIKWNWASEAARHVKIRCQVLEGMAPRRPRVYTPNTIWVLNYDILGPWLPFLKSLRPQLVIFDESHYVKSRSAKRTKNLRALCEGAPHVLALSGTPLVNRPAELWPTLNILQPKLYKSFWNFAREHCNLRRTHWGWDFSGARDLRGLHKKLKEQLMLRVRKAEALPDLPPKMRSVVPLPIQDRRQYQRALTDFAGWLKDNSPKKARRAAKAEQLVKLGYLKRLAAKLKRRALYEWLDDFLMESDDKLLVYAVHKKMIRRLYERYKDQAVYVTGEVQGRERQDRFDQFNHNKGVRILIGNIIAAGVGWSASKCSAVAFAELDWVPGNHTQCEDRCHGIMRGVQGTRTRVFYLVARDTIETSLCKILQEKQQVLSATMDGRRCKEDLDIHDQLCREILKGKGK